MRTSKLKSLLVSSPTRFLSSVLAIDKFAEDVRGAEAF